jgi:hypothetical protein
VNEPRGDSYTNALAAVRLADASVRWRIVIPVRERAIVASPRLSPDGRLLAYLETVASFDDAPTLLVMRLEMERECP